MAATVLRDGRAVILSGWNGDDWAPKPTGIYARGRWFEAPPVTPGSPDPALVGDHLLVAPTNLTNGPTPLLWYGVASDCPVTPAPEQRPWKPADGSYP
jgi:hypothetical protein